MMLARKDRLIQEMRQILAAFHTSVKTRYMTLTNKHRQERGLVLHMLAKERKAGLGAEWRRRADLENKEQKSRASKNKKLFLDDSASL